MYISSYLSCHDTLHLHPILSQNKPFLLEATFVSYLITAPRKVTNAENVTKPWAEHLCKNIGGGGCLGDVTGSKASELLYQDLGKGRLGKRDTPVDCKTTVIKMKPEVLKQIFISPICVIITPPFSPYLPRQTPQFSLYFGILARKWGIQSTNTGLTSTPGAIWFFILTVGFLLQYLVRKCGFLLFK